MKSPLRLACTWLFAAQGGVLFAECDTIVGVRKAFRVARVAICCSHLNPRHELAYCVFLRVSAHNDFSGFLHEVKVLGGRERFAKLLEQRIRFVQIQPVIDVVLKIWLISHLSAQGLHNRVVVVVECELARFFYYLLFL